MDIEKLVTCFEIQFLRSIELPMFPSGYLCRQNKHIQMLDPLYIQWANSPQKLLSICIGMNLLSNENLIGMKHYITVI